MGYLIGQLGGAAAAARAAWADRRRADRHADRLRRARGRATAAAVLAYRVILFWLPLLVGAPSFLWLQRELGASERQLAETRS